MIRRLPNPHLLGTPRRSADELLLLVQQGDSLAFEALYYAMVPVVRGFLHTRPWIVGTEDIVQEVFCRVWEQQGNFVSGRARAKSYLISLALNVAREQRRDARRTDHLAIDVTGSLAGGSQPTKAVLENELGQLLRTARKRLPQNQEAAVRLVYDEQIESREAADRLGCSEQALHRRILKARRKLRDILTQRE